MLEISCGVILYTFKNHKPHYLLIKDYYGNVGFAKGHIEKGETELMAALRETKEETSIIPNILEGFKATTEYLMPNGNTKRVIYFLGEYNNQTPKQNEDFEKFEFLILPYNKAYKELTFENSKELLFKANEFINNLI